MSTPALQHEVEQFLFQNAEHCDRQLWDAYLADFHEDASFHIPQWDSEHVYTTDPQREMSMIYYPNRQGLEDRVFRIRTGKSAASTPMPRTLHLVSNVRIVDDAERHLTVKAKWCTHYVRFGMAECFFREVTYTVVRVQAQLKMASKHVLLLNDRVNAVLDFYHV